MSPSRSKTIVLPSGERSRFICVPSLVSKLIVRVGTMQRESQRSAAGAGGGPRRWGTAADGRGHVSGVREGSKNLYPALDRRRQPTPSGTPLGREDTGDSLTAAQGRLHHRGMPRTTALGRYLRARRELVRPEDAGLANSGGRRPPGLRRG